MPWLSAISLFPAVHDRLVAVLARIVVGMGADVLGVKRRNGHDQPTVLHTLEPDKQVGKALHAGGLAVNNQHFEAGIEVQMRVTR